MGANLYWQTMKGKCIPTNTPSTTCEALRNAFGPLPMEIGTASLPVLHGLAAGSQDPAEPFVAISEAITKHGTIRIWAEF